MEMSIGKKHLRKRMVPYLFIAPVMLLLLVFNIVPLLGAFGTSLFDITTTLNNSTFLGLGNFQEVFTDWRFWNSLKVTFKWTIVEVPIQLFIAISLAGLLTKNTKSNKIFRAIYFMPIICSATATGIMWKLILHSNVGYVTYMFRLLGFGKINFMNNSDITIYVIVFMSVWKTFGISTTILIGAMQNVPNSLYEAADIDNCGKFKQFFYITLPSVKPTLWFLVMTRVIGSFQVFDIVYTTTGGGPNYTTETLVSYIYTRGFEINRMGYASALSIVLLAIVLLITLVMYTAMLRRETD
ncbi:MAG TPA: sugar ABC transporter permease [Candidatus Limiplasma sp.]|nr:sugar ABC transporter permease [Candidatus Limiplasma sp.]HRX08033.1 sugar ABC transporter permease [Candidatus Limiplasma sp.]